MLRIAGATREDYGQYRCIVENSVGQDSCSFTVAVADAPEGPTVWLSSRENLNAVVVVSGA